MTHTQPASQPSILIALIVAILAPMFLGVTGGDIQMAREAAFATLSEYRTRNQLDLIAIAQIIAFGLASICVLSRSLDDTIPIPEMLTLHRTANALNRSVEQNRRALRQNRETAPPPLAPAPDLAPPPSSDTFLSAMAEQTLASESESRLHSQATSVTPPPTDTTRSEISEKRQQEMWAIAMVAEASEITASLPNLPPGERRAASIRAGALGSAANEILTGVSPKSIGPERNNSKTTA